MRVRVFGRSGSGTSGCEGEGEDEDLRGGSRGYLRGGTIVWVRRGRRRRRRRIRRCAWVRRREATT